MALKWNDAHLQYQLDWYIKVVRNEVGYEPRPETLEALDEEFISHATYYIFQLAQGCHWGIARQGPVTEERKQRYGDSLVWIKFWSALIRVIIGKAPLLKGYGRLATKFRDHILAEWQKAQARAESS